MSSTPVADGATLLDERRGMVYHLNHTGAIALTAMLGSGPEAAATALRDRYAVAAETARQDVSKLLDALVARHLVVTS